MAYSTIIKPNTNFNPVLYTGNGGTQSITGVNFQPDFVWVKGRTNAPNHYLFDSVRGVQKNIHSNTNDAEVTEANTLTAFDSDGFTLGSDGNPNGSGQNYVGWNWLAGTAVSGATTGAGTAKTYTGSVNTTSGFSIIKYTGNGTAGHTIPHNLGVTPSAIFVKGLSALSNWSSYHSVLGNTGYMRLDGTGAFATASTYWNNTSPTSSVFTLGTTGNVNADGNDFIAYCFADVKGFSKFGSYVGNGNADGTFIYTGFKPAFIMIKPSSKVEAWSMFDTKRVGYNPDNNYLYANENYAEGTNERLDIVSNGFKIRSSTGEINTSAATMIYMAFAENPLVANTSGGIPTTAR